MATTSVRGGSRSWGSVSGVLLTVPSSLSLSRGSHHLCQDVPAESWRRAPCWGASSVGGSG